MIRAVLDTNVLVSAAIRPGGKPDQILRQLPEQFDLVISEYILEELDSVASRRHIQTKYKEQVTPQKWSLFVARIRGLAMIVTTKTDLSAIVSDPDDAAVLATAIDGLATYLVTGDRHLLSIRKYKTVEIVPPGEFLNIIIG